MWFKSFSSVRVLKIIHLEIRMNPPKTLIQWGQPTHHAVWRPWQDARMENSDIEQLGLSRQTHWVRIPVPPPPRHPASLSVLPVHQLPLSGAMHQTSHYAPLASLLEGLDVVKVTGEHFLGSGSPSALCGGRCDLIVERDLILFVIHIDNSTCLQNPPPVLLLIISPRPILGHKCI